MEHDGDLTALPLMDDPAVKDVFAEFCTGLNFVAWKFAHDLCLGHGRSQRAASSIKTDRLSRIVMRIIGAVELRDLLTQLIDALTEQGVIIPKPRSRP